MSTRMDKKRIDQTLANHLGASRAVAGLSLQGVIASVVGSDVQVLKFILLVAGGEMMFFLWLLPLSHSAQIWKSRAHFENPLTKHTRPPHMTDTGDIEAAKSVDLFYIDVWFALALMAAVDAFAIVINFNRSLIHQFHYFVSLRMMSLAFIASLGFLLLSDSKHNMLRPLWHPAAVFLLCCTLYTASIVVPERLHKLLPARGICASRGSLRGFCEQMCMFDLTWRHALMLAGINGAAGFVITTVVPAEWSMLNPVVHITWEVTVLGLMSTKQTPRYIWFATPVVQASTCTDWGLRQVISSPRLVAAPWAFLALMFAGRLLLDLHLHTLFRHRFDLHWARSKILFSTTNLLVLFAAMLLLEYLGLPVVTFIKPIAVVTMHAFGVLVFLMPASYALAFNKIKTIRR